MLRRVLTFRFSRHFASRSPLPADTDKGLTPDSQTEPIAERISSAGSAAEVATQPVETSEAGVGQQPAGNSSAVEMVVRETVQLDAPDAEAMQDGAPMADRVPAEALDGGSTASLSDAEVVGCFESLGDNCEFAFFQRKLGLEPLGVFRWAGTKIPSLLRGFMDDFDAGPDLNIGLYTAGANREYMLRIMPFGWLSHTFVFEGEQPADKVLKEQTVKFRYLASKLIEDLEQGKKIFVFRCNEPIVDDSIYALHDALNWYGPNTLLWVVEADDANEPGSVRWLRPGLMQGYVSRLAVRLNATLVSQTAWAQVCRAAYDLWHDREQSVSEPWMESRLLQRIRFGAEGTAAPFCTAGWGRQERGFAWGTADASTLTLPCPEPCAAYMLKLSVKPFRPDGMLRQRLSILVNGEHVKTFSAVPEGMAMCRIPGELVIGREKLEVMFVCPGGLSPKDAKVGEDARKLTIEFREARLYGLSPR